MDNNVLKAYLVSIGYKVDEQQFRKFQDAQKKTGAGAAQLSTQFKDVVKQLEKMAIAVAAFIGIRDLAETFKDISQGLEDLYFSSKRAGASAGNLQAFQYGMEQIGISAQSATAMVENLKLALVNPGNVSLLKTLGINPNQDNVNVTLDLIKRLSTMPDYLGKEYAKSFGIGEQEYLTMKQNLGSLNQLFQDRINMTKASGVSAEQAAEQAHKYEQAVRQLDAQWGQFTTALAVQFMPTGLKVIDVLSQMMDRTTAMGAQNFSNLTSSLTYLATLAGNVGFEMTAMALATSHAMELTGAFLAGPKGFDQRIAEINKRYASLGDNLFSAMSQVNAATNNPPVAKSNYTRQPWSRPSVWRLSPGVLGFNPGNLRPGQGFEGESGTISKGKSGTFASFASAESGLRALARDLLTKEYHDGLNTIAKIITKYAPASENNTPAYIADMSRQLGINPDTPLNLKDSPQLQAMMRGIIHHEQGFDPYNARMIAQAADFRLGNGTAAVRGDVTLHQKTDIHVTGSADPKATADFVLSGQESVNAKIITDMNGKTR
jgi:hypothetical protein